MTFPVTRWAKGLVFGALLLTGCTEAEAQWVGFPIFLAVVFAWAAITLWEKRK